MAEETWQRRHRGNGRKDLPTRTPVNRFDHIRSIIDAVFGPDDDSPVPTARSMIAPLDLTRCAGCGTTMPPGAVFHLCDACHWKDIEEAALEQSPLHHAFRPYPEGSCARRTPPSP